ncbi:MAG TPA: DUF4340 domain-containing protein [Vicinamibacterales bacterium]|nr:DUF4340 domain-containing protein [Vicinamibacterales bacterium]
MGRFRSTLILLVIALAFGGYLYFVDSKRPVEDANAKKKVFSYEADKINQLQVKSSTGEATALRKDSGGVWTITAPATATADRNGVSDIVTSLANLEEDRVVEENAPDLKTYGLASPRIEATFHVEGDKEPKRLLIGDKNPSGMGLYAKLPNGNRVFLVSNSLDATINKSTFDLRDKTALTLQQDKVTSIEIASRTGTIRLEKTGGDWKLVKPLQAPADFTSVSGLLGQLQSAQMTALKNRPEDLKDLRQYGLDKPEVVATIGMGGSAMTLELGNTAAAGSVWARDPSKAAVFSVNNGVAEELKKTPAELRRKEVFDFRPFNTTRFEIARGKDIRGFERVKGTGENAVDTWKQVAPTAKTADTSNLEGALLEFSNLRAESFVDRAGAATGHSSPAAVVTVKFEDGKKEERVTFGTTSGNTFAARPDQPGALKLEAGKFEAAIKKLDAIQ